MEFFFKNLLLRSLLVKTITEIRIHLKKITFLKVDIKENAIFKK